MITRFCLTCTFLCAICIIKAQDKSAYVADSLFDARLYFEASVEYERVLFTTSEQRLRINAQNRNIQCYKQRRLFAPAVKLIKDYLTENLPDSNRYQLFEEQIVCSYLAGGYEEAVSLVEQVELQFPNEKSNVKLMMIETLSLNKLHQWQKAEPVFTALTKNFRESVPVENPYLKLPRQKSVDKAKWLATFIPGGGQFYAGKPWEALVSIVIQGAGVYYGVISFQQKYYLSAWLAGAGLFGSFHMGGVRRSEMLVNQYNTKKANQFNQQVENILLKLFETDPKR